MNALQFAYDGQPEVRKIYKALCITFFMLHVI
jgi:hypothetical protein